MSHNLFELNSFPDKLTLSLPLNINSLLPKKELKFFQSEKFVDSMQLALLSVVIGFLLYLAERFLGSNVEIFSSKSPLHIFFKEEVADTKVEQGINH